MSIGSIGPEKKRGEELQSRGDAKGEEEQVSRAAAGAIRGAAHPQATSILGEALKHGATQELKGLQERVDQMTLPQVVQAIQDVGTAIAIGQASKQMAKPRENYNKALAVYRLRLNAFYSPLAQVLKQPVIPEPTLSQALKLLQLLETKGPLNKTPLIIASEAGMLDQVEVLLNAGANPHAKTSGGSTSLMLAAEDGHDAVVQRLLKVSNIEVNGTNLLGQSALSLAASWGHGAVIKRLLAMPGIDVNLKCTGITPLMVAAFQGHHAVVQMLVEAPGIEVNLRGPAGYTALMHVSQAGRDVVVQVLLATPGIEVNIQGRDGHTALMCASEEGHAVVVQRLLATPGIDLGAKDSKGKTALALADEMGHADIAQLLIDAGATE